MMKKALLFGAALLGIASVAQAGVGVSFGFDIPLGPPEQVVVGRPVPVYETPAPVYQAPAPVYQAPAPVYPPLNPVYQGPPVYAAPAPYYVAPPVISLGFGFGGSHYGGHSWGHNHNSHWGHYHGGHHGRW